MNDVDWEHLARGTMTFEQFDSFHIRAWANPSHEIVDRQMRLARVRNIYGSSQAAQRANNFLRFTRAAAHAVCEDLKASAAIQLHSVQNVVQVDDMMYKLCKSAPHGTSSWSSSPACKPAVLCFLGIVIWVPVNSASMQELTWELLCMLFIGGIISARGECAVVCTACLLHLLACLGEGAGACSLLAVFLEPSVAATAVFLFAFQLEVLHHASASGLGCVTTNKLTRFTFAESHAGCRLRY